MLSRLVVFALSSYGIMFFWTSVSALKDAASILKQDSTFDSSKYEKNLCIQTNSMVGSRSCRIFD